MTIENASITMKKTKLEDTTNMAMGFPISNLRIEQISTPRPTPYHLKNRAWSKKMQSSCSVYVAPKRKRAKAKPSMSVILWVHRDHSVASSAWQFLVPPSQELNQQIL